MRMDALGPRARRTFAAGTGGRATLLLPATRMPAAPWKVRDAFMVLASGLFLLLTALVVTLGLSQLQTAGIGGSGADGTISNIVAAIYFLFLLCMMRAIIMQRYRCGWRTLGLRPVGWQWLAAVPFVYALLTFAFVVMYRAMLLVLGPATTWPQPFTANTVHAGGQPLPQALAIFSGVLLAPVAEELLFRGVLYQALRRSMPVWRAVLISALIFALMHFNPALFIPYAFMGVVLAFLYEWSGSLIPTILVHACNNAILLLVIFGTQR